jgi:Leucine-rich repeat (LRR) protein
MNAPARLAVVIGVLLFAGSSLMVAAAQRPDERDSVDKIEKLGGAFRVDPKKPNNPVIEVDLRNTGVTDADLQLLKDLPDLRVLILGGPQGTKVTDKGLEHLKGSVNLQRLHLYGTPITDEGMVHLKGLTDLRLLHIVGTRVSPDGLKHLKGMTKLEQLDYAGIDDAGLAHLKGLTSLKTLHLYQCTVTDAGLEHLADLTNLQSLHFGSAKITDHGLKHLKKLADLRDLSLDAPPGHFGGGNPITDAGIEHLKGLTKLEILNIRHTQVTNAGVKQILKELPKLKVEGRGSQVPPE